MGYYCMAASAAVSVLGGQKSGKANKKADYDEASGVQLEARVRAKNIRKLAAETRGAARAGYAASGVVVDEGSALAADAYITRESELDALYTILSGDMRAKSLRKTGAAAQDASGLGSIGSVLGTYASFAGSS